MVSLLRISFSHRCLFTKNNMILFESTVFCSYDFASFSVNWCFNFVLRLIRVPKVKAKKIKYRYHTCFTLLLSYELLMVVFKQEIRYTETSILELANYKNIAC